MDLKILYPTNKPYITQRYGVKSPKYLTYHHGTDFRVWNDPKREIKACYGGKVIFVDTFSTNNWYKDGKKKDGKTTSCYGVHCIIEHEIGGVVYYSLYGHLDQCFVNEGEIVKAGHILGKGGNTGQSEGAHLHFEFRKGTNKYTYALNAENFFVDHLEAMPEWGKDAWLWGENNKILSEASTFDDVLTKGELIVLLYRYHKKYHDTN